MIVGHTEVEHMIAGHIGVEHRPMVVHKLKVEHRLIPMVGHRIMVERILKIKRPMEHIQELIKHIVEERQLIVEVDNIATLRF
jgi:hypothetical protein